MKKFYSLCIAGVVVILLFILILITLIFSLLGRLGNQLKSYCAIVRHKLQLYAI